jgi:hypothetical protein
LNVPQLVEYLNEGHLNVEELAG